jgi:hypothetical protein
MLALIQTHLAPDWSHVCGLGAFTPGACPGPYLGWFAQDWEVLVTIKQ